MRSAGNTTSAVAALVAIQSARSAAISPTKRSAVSVKQSMPAGHGDGREGDRPAGADEALADRLGERRAGGRRLPHAAQDVDPVVDAESDADAR